MLGKLVVGEVSVGEVRSLGSCCWGTWVGELGVGEVALGKLPNTVFLRLPLGNGAKGGLSFYAPFFCNAAVCC